MTTPQQFTTGDPVSPTTTKRTFVYVDSFNLYFGILRRNHPGFKWLDLHNWLMKLLPPATYDLQKIKFFTAKVSGKYDPSKPLRQDIYFRAVRTLPMLEMIFGTFLFKRAKIHVTPDVDILGMAPEEKGTDVNLAVHLLNDAHKKLFDTAVIVSNDSDLAEVVKIVT